MKAILKINRLSKKYARLVIYGRFLFLAPSGFREIMEHNGPQP
jgi:hypothetical protein